MTGKRSKIKIINIMEYDFSKSKITSKNYSMILQLKNNIDKGLDCAVATKNPERLKRDFEYMTGKQLNLKSRDGNKDLYTATL